MITSLRRPAASLIAVFLLSAPSAFAQTDAQVTAARQLLDEANGRVIQYAAQAQALQIENARLKAELDKLKPAAEPPRKDP